MGSCTLMMLSRWRTWGCSPSASQIVDRTDRDARRVQGCSDLGGGVRPDPVGDECVEGIAVVETRGGPETFEIGWRGAADELEDARDLLDPSDPR